MRYLLISSLSLLFVACATTHPGVVAKGDSSKLVVSVDNNKDISDKYYLFLEYTFENKSSEWMSVNVPQLGFNHQDTEILTNDKLSAWIEGAELKLKKSQYNTNLILSSMVVVGAVAGGASSNGNVQVAGLATAGLAATAGAVQEVQSVQQKANSGQKGLNGTVHVPKSHVLVPFQVAPESYVKKWVVVRVPKKIKIYKEADGNVSIKWKGANSGHMIPTHYETGRDGKRRYFQKQYPLLNTEVGIDKGKLSLYRANINGLPGR